VVKQYHSELTNYDQAEGLLSAANPAFASQTVWAQVARWRQVDPVG
jgi:hypothetical protein